MRSLGNLLCFFTLLSCVSPYDFSIKNEDKLLVVEGRLFEVDSSYISLSYSAQNTNSAYLLPISDANVLVIENDNMEIPFSFNNAKNVYSPNDKNFRGKPGNSYQLKFILASGQSYISNIDTLISTKKPKNITNNFVSEKSRYDVFTEFKPKDNSNNYYLFNFTNFKQAKSCTSCSGQFLYDRENPNCSSPFGQCNNTINSSFNFRDGYGFPCLESRSCWNYKNIRENLIYSDEVLAQGTNRTIRIFKVPFSSSSRYFLEVHQNKISKQAYDYFKLINEGSETGTLFDPVPALIVGNVFKENNPKDFVLGYFVVAGQQVYGYNIDRTIGSAQAKQISENKKIEFIDDIRLLSRDLNDCPLGPPAADCVINGIRTNVKPIDWVFDFIEE